MLVTLLRRFEVPSPNLAGSILYDENTFYTAFLKDLARCRSEVIIECPFITYRRLAKLLPALKKLKEMRVRIVVNTRDPHEHDGDWREEAQRALAALQRIGVHVVYTQGHHRKLTIIDRGHVRRFTKYSEPKQQQ